MRPTVFQDPDGLLRPLPYIHGHNHISHIAAALREGFVGPLDLIVHVVCAGRQGSVDHRSQVGRIVPLSLGGLDILVAEILPFFRGDRVGLNLDE